jgi:hypothetical protein
MSDLELDENTWKALQKRLDYSNEEMETFKKNPRNQDILSNHTDVSASTRLGVSFILMVQVISLLNCVRVKYVTRLYTRLQT